MASTVKRENAIPGNYSTDEQSKERSFQVLSSTMVFRLPDFEFKKTLRFKYN